MTVLKRMRQIVAANLNHLLEKAEDPEMMVKQLIREMDESIVRLRLEVAKAIAAEKRIARRRDEAAARAETWRVRSEKALAEGDDKTARQAIRKKLDAEDVCAELTAQQETAEKLSTGMKLELRQLEDKIQDARRRKEILIARKRRAEAQQTMLNTSQEFGRVSERADTVLSGMSDSSVSVDSLEDQVMGMEEEAAARRELRDAGRELEADLSERERADAVERELQEMKSRLQKRD